MKLCPSLQAMRATRREAHTLARAAAGSPGRGRRQPIDAELPVKTGPSGPTRTAGGGQMAPGAALTICD